VLAALEGAFLLSRSLRNIEPMTACSKAAVALVEAALTPDPTSPETTEDPTTMETTA